MLDELGLHNNRTSKLSFFPRPHIRYCLQCLFSIQNMHYICRNASIGFSVLFHSSCNKSRIAE